MDEPRILPTRDGYDLWAETYDAMGNWLLALEEPEVERALGGVRGLDLLDVGCGTGRHAIRLAADGARVAALDFSIEMLKRAQVKAGAERVRFVVHDATTPLPFAGAVFDRVLSALVLEHIPDTGAFFAELDRVTRPRGRILVTAMHPAMFERGISARFRGNSGEEIRPRSYPATLADYLGAVNDAGLILVALTEHAADEGLASRFPRAAAYLGSPALLVMTLAPRERRVI